MHVATWALHFRSICYRLVTETWSWPCSLHPAGGVTQHPLAVREAQALLSLPPPNDRIMTPAPRTACKTLLLAPFLLAASTAAAAAAALDRQFQP